MTKDQISLNAFNKSFLWGGYPKPVEMNFVIGIKGKLELEKIREAIKEIIQETPLLQTRIVDRIFYVKRELVKETENFAIDNIFQYEDLTAIHSVSHNAGYDTVKINFINSTIDLYREPPIRFLVCKTKQNECEFFMKLHHSVCDGYGGYVLISYIFQRYNTLLNGKNSLSLPDINKSCSLQKMIKSAKRIYKETKRKNNFDQKSEKNKLKSKASTLRDTITFDGIIKNRMYTLENAEFQQVKYLAKHYGCSINDILLALIGTTTYSLLYKRNKLEHSFKFMQAVSIRNELGIDSILANIVSLYEMSISSNTFSDIQKAIMAIPEQTRDLLKNKLYLHNAFITNVSYYLPLKVLRFFIKKAAKKLLHSSPPVTAFISNTGRLDTLLEPPLDCEFMFTWSVVPPHVIFGIDLLWGLSTVKDNLTINLTYLDPLITQNTANEIMELFIKELYKLLQLPIK